MRRQLALTMTAAPLLAICAAANGAALQPVLDRLRAEQRIPGVSAVVTVGDDVVFSGASGVADIETGEPMTPATKLYAGSLSKVFTAVLALRLVEQEQLSLRQTVADIAGRDDIEVRHLLTHASGLEREGDFGYWFTADFPDAIELRAYLERTQLRSEPGTQLHYSNIGYATLGLVVEEATDMAYALALEEYVLQPLGMFDSGAPGPADGVSIGYTPVGRIIPNAERPFAGVGRQVGDRHVREYHDAAAMSPAFGIYTSADDMGRLLRFLMGHGGSDVLSAAMRDRMHTRQDSGWGLGLKIDRFDGRRVARHEGWFAAHRSHLFLDMDNGIGVIVLTNSDGSAPARIAEALVEAAGEQASREARAAQ